jgi:multiple sugar transport system substrate-binding protein
MKPLKFALLIVLFALSVSLFASCSSKSVSVATTSETESTDPVTLKIGLPTIILNEVQFNKYIVQPVQKKYPYITLELVNTSAKGSTFAELVAAGDIPDVVGLWLPEIQRVEKLGILENMDPLMKKYNLDASRFAPEIWNTLRMFSGQSYTVAVPIYYNTIALLYNKDIFDNFGVPYPADNMTWEDVIALARKVGRGEGEDLYTGFYPDGINRLAMQLDLPYTDATGTKGALNTDAWKAAFDLWKSILDVQHTPAKGYPFEKGRVAMIAAHINIIRDAMANKSLNWDIVTYPQSKSRPGVGQRPDGPSLAVTAASKHQDAAFKVMQTVVSPEVQLDMTRDGNLGSLADPQIREQFGQNAEDFKGKNVQAFLKLKFANGAADPPVSATTAASKFVMKEFNAAYDANMDMNTALRTINEKLDSMLAAISAQ